MREEIIIRQEKREDWDQVARLTRAAFWKQEYVEKYGLGATEHYMVHAMRGREGIEELTFVAVKGDKILGHIIYTRGSYILKPDQTKVDVLVFGPLSVLPAYQSQGIGTKLMNTSIEKARALGYGAILIYGHPSYYPRFGFKEAKEFGITTASGDNFPAFMAMELTKGFLDKAKGRFILADIFDDDANREKAKTYDQTFFQELQEVL